MMPGEHGSGAARPSGFACAAERQGATGPPVTAEDILGMSGRGPAGTAGRTEVVPRV